MSRVGKKILTVPSSVTMTVEGKHVTVSGPKGTLSHILHEDVSIKETSSTDGVSLEFEVKDPNSKFDRAQWGTARAIVANLIQGVTEGFQKQLEVNGVGYRVNLSGRTLVLTVGFSHDVRFELPEGVDAAVEENVITLRGADKQQIGEIAAYIRRIRKPEPYKGKGIKYVGEVIRRKAGKAQKAGE